MVDPIKVEPGETRSFTLEFLVPAPTLSEPVCAAYMVDTLLSVGPYIIRSQPHWVSWDYKGVQGTEYLLASGEISSGEELSFELSPNATTREIHIALN